MRKEFAIQEFTNLRSFRKQLRLALSERGIEYAKEVQAVVNTQVTELVAEDEQRQAEQAKQQKALEKVLASAEKAGLSVEDLAMALQANKPKAGRPAGAKNKPKAEAESETE